METLSPDLLVYIAMNMDVPEILSFCETSPQFNRLICKNQKFWMNRIMTEFPNLNIRDYAPDYYQSYRQLAYREIGINVIVSILDEATDWEESEEDWENDEIESDSIVRLRTNLPDTAVREIFYLITSRIIDSIIETGDLTISVNNQDASCDIKTYRETVSMECFKDINDQTQSVNIYYVALDIGDPQMYYDNLDDILNNAIVQGKAEYYGL